MTSLTLLRRQNDFNIILTSIASTNNERYREIYLFLIITKKTTHFINVKINVTVTIFWNKSIAIKR